MKEYLLFLCLDIVFIAFLATALWIEDSIFMCIITYFVCLVQIVEINRIEKGKRKSNYSGHLIQR